MYLDDRQELPVDLEDFLLRLPSKQSVKHLLEEFLKVYPEYLDDLVYSVNTGDAEKIRISAHTLKGVLSNLSIRKGTELACELEKSSSDTNREDLYRQVVRLEQELEKVKSFILSEPVQLV